MIQLFETQIEYQTFVFLIIRGRTTNDREAFILKYNTSGVLHEILQRIDIPIVSGIDCGKEYGVFKKDTQLCAGTEEGNDLLHDYIE